LDLAEGAPTRSVSALSEGECLPHRMEELEWLPAKDLRSVTCSDWRLVLPAKPRVPATELDLANSNLSGANWT